MGLLDFAKRKILNPIKQTYHKTIKPIGRKIARVVAKPLQAAAPIGNLFSPGIGKALELAGDTMEGIGKGQRLNNVAKNVLKDNVLNEWLKKNPKAGKAAKDIAKSLEIIDKVEKTVDNTDKLLNSKNIKEVVDNSKKLVTDVKGADLDKKTNELLDKVGDIGDTADNLLKTTNVTSRIKKMPSIGRKPRVSTNASRLMKRVEL